MKNMDEGSMTQECESRLGMSRSSKEWHLSLPRAGLLCLLQIWVFLAVEAATIHEMQAIHRVELRYQVLVLARVRPKPAAKIQAISRRWASHVWPASLMQIPWQGGITAIGEVDEVLKLVNEAVWRTRKDTRLPLPFQLLASSKSRSRLCPLLLPLSLPFCPLTEFWEKTPPY